MRLGRIILLASLAQLLGLPALMAALTEHPAFTADRAPEAAPAWGGSPYAPVAVAVVSFSAHVRGASQAVLALTALAETPLRRSLWMVAPAVRTVAVPRPRRLILLRC
jgi:hypothetical protein